MKVFLTGDRSLPPQVSYLAALVAFQDLAQVHPDLTPEDVLTGDLGGFESAVRFLLPGVRVVESTVGPDGKPDLDARHGEAIKDADECWVFHPDPLDSRVYASAAKFWDDEGLQVVTL